MSGARLFHKLCENGNVGMLSLCLDGLRRDQRIVFLTEKDVEHGKTALLFAAQSIGCAKVLFLPKNRPTLPAQRSIYFTYFALKPTEKFPTLWVEVDEQFIRSMIVFTQMSFCALFLLYFLLTFLLFFFSKIDYNKRSRPIGFGIGG